MRPPTSPRWTEKDFFRWGRMQRQIALRTKNDLFQTVIRVRILNEIGKSGCWPLRLNPAIGIVKKHDLRTMNQRPEDDVDFR